MYSATHICKLPGPLIVVALLAMALTGTLAAQEPATPPANAPSREGPPNDNLDLRAPSLHDVYTEEQIEALLAKARSEEESDVEVESTRERPPTVTPEIWPAIAAPFWALLHPTDAWRIFFPLPPDQTRGKQEKPDATDPKNLPELPPQLPFR
ncbi:MAG TPA: hypothetical protein VLD59_01830 [Steroidobacteraceae bacterium]|nr:hypothetical protein [Steroidobacteraceae bacterium]